MKTKLLVATLLAGSSLFAETHLSIGIGVGGHGYAAPPVVAYRPHYPGPGYVWVDGYWDQVGPRRFWREGYWSRPSYRRPYAVERRFDENRYNGRDVNRYSNGYNGYDYNRGQANGNNDGRRFDNSTGRR